MKIGILTFHMAHNFGAMLQAYALCMVCRKISNCTCEIIDYRLPEIYAKYEKLLRGKEVEKKRIKFHDFMINKLPLSQRITDCNYIPYYDLYVVGSDQIWNPNITGGYKDEYFGRMFPMNSYCVAYAASTGIDIDEWEDIVKRLDRINKVGVRESWCVDKLSSISQKEVTFCIDPVLLLNREEWENIGIVPEYNNYILVYAFEMTELEYTDIENQAKSGNYRIIEIVTHERNKRDNILYDFGCGPQEFIGYIQNAETVYTDSYHGILFSILFNKHFVYLSRGEKNDKRVLDILKHLELNVDKIGKCITDVEDRVLEKYKKESIEFLQTCIDEVNFNK